MIVTLSTPLNYTRLNYESEFAREKENQPMPDEEDWFTLDVSILDGEDYLKL